MSHSTKVQEGSGVKMYGWAQDLFPIHRSITGAGVRETLAYLGNLLPGLVVHAVPSGTQAFDCTIKLGRVVTCFVSKIPFANTRLIVRITETIYRLFAGCCTFCNLTLNEDVA